MPVTPTYPGVYIQEVPSNVHAITPVPTATTAFIGRAQRGPVNDPVVCNGFADFEQTFGGLWLDSKLGFAVRDFFLNGGGQAVIVRVYHSDTAVKAAQAAANAADAANAAVDAQTAAAAAAKAAEAADAAKAAADAAVAAPTEAAKATAAANAAADAAKATDTAKTAADAAKTHADAVAAAAPTNTKAKAAQAAATQAVLYAAQAKIDADKFKKDAGDNAAKPAASTAATAASSAATAKTSADKAKDSTATAAANAAEAANAAADVQTAAQTAAQAAADADAAFKATAAAKAAADAAAAAPADAVLATAAAKAAAAAAKATDTAKTTADLAKTQADAVAAAAPTNTEAKAAQAAATQAAQDAAQAKADADANAAKPAASTAATAASSAATAKTSADKAKDSTAAAAAAVKAAVDAAGKATLTVGGLALRAKSPGMWGTELAVRITYPDSKVSKQLADRYKVGPDALFNLTIRDRATGVTEFLPNLTVIASTRQVDKVIAHESQLVEYVSGPSEDRPAQSNDPATESPPQKVDPWSDEKYYTPADKTSGSDGGDLNSDDFIADEAGKKGVYALEHADIFNLLCIPPYIDSDTNDVDVSVLQDAAAYCEKRRAMLIVDPPPAWNSKKAAIDGYPIQGLAPSTNAAVFFPRINEQNPLRENQVESFVPSGAVAGIMARTDLQRGVWKAAAGLEASLRGVIEPSIPLTDAENGELNPLGINCLRTLPAAGNVVWGARTMVGDDRLASQWKYVPVRRTALFIEESLYRGTQWAVFEPNDEPLWSQLRLNIGVFMHDLFRQGAFQGQSPQEAYFVRCDATTTTQSDRDRGIVNVIVGFAPLKPAEFVILYIQQIAGQLEV